MALRFRLCVGGLRGGEHVPGSARALACPHRRIADVRGGPGRSMLLRLWASWLLSGQAGSLRMNQRLCDMPARSDDRRGRRSLHARRVRSPEVDGGVLAFSTRDRPTGNLSNQHSSFTSFVYFLQTKEIADCHSGQNQLTCFVLQKLHYSVVIGRINDPFTS